MARTVVEVDPDPDPDPIPNPEQVARTVVAVATGDEAAILAIAKESRFRTKHNDPTSLVNYTRFVWEGSLRELAKLAQQDPVEQTDGELVMVRRAVVLTRSVASVMGCPVNMAREWEPIARRVLADAGEAVREGGGGGGGRAAEEEEQGVDAGDGVRVELLRTGKDAKVEGMRVTAAAIGWQGGSAGGATSFTWEDEYTALIWPNSKVRGNTLAAVIGSYGEGGLLRLMGVAGRAARGMTRAGHEGESGGGGGGGGGGGFRLEAGEGKQCEADDRLQLARALCYMAWGLAGKALAKKPCAAGELGDGRAHYYAISAGLKTIKLSGPFADLQREVSKNATVEREVGKYFPRTFWDAVVADAPPEIAPRLSEMFDLVLQVLGLPGQLPPPPSYLSRISLISPSYLRPSPTACLLSRVAGTRLARCRRPARAAALLTPPRAPFRHDLPSLARARARRRLPHHLRRRGPHDCRRRPRRPRRRHHRHASTHRRALALGDGGGGGSGAGVEGGHLRSTAHASSAADDH